MIKNPKSNERLQKAIAYIESIPFEVDRDTLYNAERLYEGFDTGDYYDASVYRHYLSCGKHADSPEESLARSLHDFSISTAMDEFLSHYDKKKVVAIMGGHQLKRTDPMFQSIVMLSKHLAEQGYLMVSGGGPGAMEATHLGAWLSGTTDESVADAVQMLSMAPTFKDEGWLSSAFDVMRKYPQDKGIYSLSIPTWLYGHEPSTPFATHIAKLFENSLREDGLLTIAYGGVIYTPGSAGTMQEIFQDAVQNHYLSFDFSSPMIFLGEKFWSEQVPVYPFFQTMIEKGVYRNLQLTLTDKESEIISVLENFSKK